MENFYRLIVIVLILGGFQVAKAQNSGNIGFEMMGKNPGTIQLGQTFSQNSEILPFDGKVSAIYGLAINANITFNSEKSVVRVILVDKLGDEYLVYETYPLLEDGNSVSVNNLCEETDLLNGVKPQSIKVQLSDAVLTLNSIAFSTAAEQGVDIEKVKKEKKNLQNNRKINQINKSVKSKGLAWVAGETEISSLSYSEKKKLFGQSTFPSGIEYYVGGVLSSGDGMMLKSASATSMVENWDWRNRHGKNWITDVKNQSTCGSCWSFAATGATEALVNLFYNQSLNMDLSEQNLLSCSGAGSCTGGYPSIALDYIKNTGIIDEAAFPYSATDQVCTNKSSSPADQIKIGGRVDFGSSTYPVSEDNLKKMLIKYGPLSGGLLDWSHAMTLVGWQVVKEGDRFFYRNLNKSTIWYTVPAGSTLIGKTVWIFKNSWGSSWGDGGFIYVETSITNFSWTHALVTPLQSLKQNYTVQCVDNDHDGYYWWGLGPKPANCPPCPDAPDGNDADATLGPLDSYGNCIALNSAPVADFTSDITTVNENGAVNFADMSINAPVSWSWTFDGGYPATSTAMNPSVSYKVAGKYNVTLVVTNANGNSTKVKTGYVTVNAPVLTYSSSHGNASKEWINKVTLNGTAYTSNSTGSTGYADLTANVFNVNANGTYSMSLTPKYSGKANYWYWSVWIDLNQDFDFDDAGEQVLVASKSKTAVSQSITIPSTAYVGATRMRVSMKRDALPAPNEVFAYGEVKDYTINISAPVAASDLKSAQMEEATIASALSLTVFPNPAERTVNLKLDNFSGNEYYTIYNMQGVIVKSEQIGSNITPVDVTGLPAGIFIVQVRSGEQTMQQKFIKR